MNIEGCCTSWSYDFHNIVYVEHLSNNGYKCVDDDTLPRPSRPIDHHVQGFEMFQVFARQPLFQFFDHSRHNVLLVLIQVLAEVVSVGIFLG